MIEIGKLKPFPRFCYTIGMIPSSYKDSLTYEEQLLWFCDFLQNNIIPTVNNNGLAVEELQNLFVELTNYVDNYFENLDVQTEINNKLDDLVESGTLEQILADYFNSNAVFCFNTVNDMKASETLTNGSFAKTLGFYSYKDNGGALYKIRTATNEDTVDNMTVFSITNSDNLIAEIVNLKNTVDIRQLGAKTNASFDNIYVIQKALTLFDKVIVADGTYKVSTDLHLKSNNYVLGNNGKLLSESPYIFSGLSISNVTIDNLYLESTVDTSNTSNMNETTPDSRGYTTLSSIINIDSSENVTIKNCTIKGGFTGIFIPRSTNVMVENCNCFEASSKIVCLSASSFKLLNNYIHDVKNPNNSGYACYLFQASDSNSSKQELSIIANNSFENNPSWDAILMHDYNKMIISNNTIKNVRQGIDLSLIPSSDNKKSGNIIISNNYLEGTSSNYWGENSAQNHAIYVSGNNNQNAITISNNIMNNFGKYYSGTSGSALCLSGAKNVNVTGNIIDFTESLTSLRAGIFLTGNCYNLNISNNIISSNNLYAILLYTLTVNTLNITNNNLITTATYAINTNGGCNITSLLLDNTFNEANTSEFCVNNGDSINSKSYTTSFLRAQYNKKYRFETSIEEFTVEANSAVTKNITKSSLGYTGTFNSRAFIAIGIPEGTFPASCLIKIKYTSSDTLTATFINTSSSDITVPTSVYEIDYKY